MFTNHAVVHAATLAADHLEARGILSGIGHAIGIFLLVVLGIGILIGFAIGRFFGRRY